MLLSFNTDGTVDFTRNKDALALVDGLGNLRVERMSEILFDVLEQSYYIQLLTGEFAGLVLRWQGAGLERADQLSMLWTMFWQDHSPALVDEYVNPLGRMTGAVYFKTYEDAVTIEVAFIDFLREQQIVIR